MTLEALLQIVEYTEDQTSSETSGAATTSVAGVAIGVAIESSSSLDP